jgi:hypothetical protein
MEWKHRTTEAARDALSRFCTRKASVMTIPVDNERDADCILSDVISERDVLILQLEETRKERELLRNAQIREEEKLRAAKDFASQMHTAFCRGKCHWDGLSCVHSKLCSEWLEKVGNLRLTEKRVGE